jgi:hypothetical protein
MISPLRPKLHETVKAWSCAAVFLFSACKTEHLRPTAQQSSPVEPARQSAEKSARPGHPDASGSPAPLGTAILPLAPSSPMSPLTLGPLRQEPAKAVMAKLLAAHYSPTSAGLQRLSFAVTFTWNRHQLTAKGEGRWKQSGGPEVELTSVERRGKIEHAPDELGVGRQIWASIKEQIESLLEGLGRGFLSDRLAQWQNLEGQSTRQKNNLVLELSSEDGPYTVLIDAHYAVEKVTTRSAAGITRGLVYQSRVVDGRNLITRAVYQARADAGAKLPVRDERIIKGSDGMTFEIDYDRVGRYYLPIRLHKNSPGTGDDVQLTIKYLTAEP